MPIPSSLKTFLILMLTVFFWSSAYVGIRIGLKGYDPGSLALFRYFIASICMSILWLRQPVKRKPTLKEFSIIFVLGVVGFAIYNITLNYGEITISAGIASFVLTQIPVLIVILAVLFLHEKITAASWTGFIVSTIGVCIIALGQNEKGHLNVGIFYLLGSVLAASVYSVFHKPLLTKFTAIEFNTYAMWSATLVLLIYSPHLFQQLPKAPLSSTLAAVYMGIFPGAIAYVAWSYVIKRMPASKASSGLYLMPIVATAIGFIVLAEIPTLFALIGGCVAMAGAILVNYKPAFKTTATLAEKRESSCN